MSNFWIQVGAVKVLTMLQASHATYEPWHLQEGGQSAPPLCAAATGSGSQEVTVGSLDSNGHVQLNLKTIEPYCHPAFGTQIAFGASASDCGCLC